MEILLKLSRMIHQIYNNHLENKKGHNYNFGKGYSDNILEYHILKRIPNFVKKELKILTSVFLIILSLITS